MPLDAKAWLLAMGLCGWGAAGAVPPGDAAALSDTLASFSLPATLEAAGRRPDAQLLRRALVERWLRQLEGEPAPSPQPTMEQWIAAGSRAAPEHEQSRRWRALLQRHLVLVPADTPVPPPPELDADAARLAALAPGLWLQRAADGSPRAAWWWLHLRHDAPTALAPGDFVLEMRTASAAGPGLRWQCTLPRYAERQLLPPARPEAFLCRLPGVELASPQAQQALASLPSKFRGPPVSPQPGWTLSLPDGALAAAVRRLEAAALGAAPPAAAPVAASPVASAPTQARARGPRQASAAPAAPVWQRVLQAGAAAAAALGVYTVLHRVGGGAFAFGLTWLAGTGLAIATAAHTLPGLRAGLAAGSQAAGLLPALGWLAAVVMPFLGTVALAVVHALLFGPREQVLRSLQRVAVGALLDALQRRLDRLLRR